MANFRQVAKHFPPVREYLRNRRWTRRGDVLAYAPNIRTPVFSTDALGFRHTSFNGDLLGLSDIDRLGRYGLVLGSSHVFGFGLPNNEATIPSQLSKQLGFPILGVSYPEADTRSLHATLIRVLSTANRAPELVLLFTGGDFTRFGFSGKADPLFGCPDFETGSQVRQPEEAASDADRLCFFVRLR
jgi:hypothetical protein